MHQQDIHHAIDRQIPDMRSRGFIIGTACGPLEIAPGWMADRLAEHLTRILQCELLYQERSRHHSAYTNTEEVGVSHGH